MLIVEESRGIKVRQAVDAAAVVTPIEAPVKPVTTTDDDDGKKLKKNLIELKDLK